MGRRAATGEKELERNERSEHQGARPVGRVKAKAAHACASRNGVEDAQVFRVSRLLLVPVAELEEQIP
jgi:hypothetical protein